MKRSYEVHSYHHHHYNYLYLVSQVKYCPECQKMNKKIATERPELHPVPVKSPWYHLSLDFVGPISPPSRTGNRYILTVSDYFTKFDWAKALSTKEAVNGRGHWITISTIGCRNGDVDVYDSMPPSVNKNVANQVASLLCTETKNITLRYVALCTCTLFLLFDYY